MIAISGKAGTGKTTLAAILVSKLGFPWIRASFADSLKKEAASLFDLAPASLYTEKGKAAEFEVQPSELEHLGIHTVYPELLSVRRILQLRGQYCRSLDRDYWVKAFAHDFFSTDNLIIDDLRYPNELDYCRDRSAYCVRLLPYSGWEPIAGDHESETALDDVSSWDMVLQPPYGGLGEIAETLLADYRSRGNA